MPAPRFSSPHLGLPADFLIGPDGRVLACSAVAAPTTSGRWTVDEVLAHAYSENA